jgi:hypothetical protein
MVHDGAVGWGTKINGEMLARTKNRSKIQLFIRRMLSSKAIFEIRRGQVPSTEIWGYVFSFKKEKREF